MRGCDLGFGKLRLIMDLAFISLIYGGVYCFLGDVWEGVRKGNVRVTGRVSSCHSPPNHELLVFSRGGGVQGLVVTKATIRHVTFHLIN